MMIAGGIIGGKTPDVTYNGVSTSWSFNSGTGVFTVSNIPLGEPTSDRKVVLGFMANRSGIGNVAAFRLAGELMTRHSRVELQEMLSIDFPSGTSANLTSFFNDGTLMSDIVVYSWSVYGLRSRNATGSNAGATTGSIQLQTESGGVVIAAARQRSTGIMISGMTGVMVDNTGATPYIRLAGSAIGVPTTSTYSVGLITSGSGLFSPLIAAVSFR